MDKPNLTPVQLALTKLYTNDYRQKYLNSFKTLARVNDEMLNGEYEDEEDDIVGTNALDIPCYALHNQGFFHGYEAGFKDCKSNWTSCVDELPDPNVGKVLVCKKNMATSIMDASVLKHSNKDETYWMPLPIFDNT